MSIELMIKLKICVQLVYTFVFSYTQIFPIHAESIQTDSSQWNETAIENGGPGDNEFMNKI